MEGRETGVFTREVREGSNRRRRRRGGKRLGVDPAGKGDLWSERTWAGHVGRRGTEGLLSSVDVVLFLRAYNII